VDPKRKPINPPLNAPTGFWAGSATVGEFKKTVDVENRRGWICGETAGRKEVRRSRENVRGFIMVGEGCSDHVTDSSNKASMIALRRWGVPTKIPKRQQSTQFLGADDER